MKVTGRECYKNMTMLICDCRPPCVDFERYHVAKMCSFNSATLPQPFEKPHPRTQYVHTSSMRNESMFPVGVAYYDEFVYATMDTLGSHTLEAVP